MLKRNLIAIAILGFGMVSGAFAQEGVRGKRPSKTNPEIKRSDAIVKPMQAEVNEITIDGTKVWGNEVKITGGRRGSSSETSRTSKPRTQTMRNIKATGTKKPTPKSLINTVVYDGTRRKQPRPRSTQKRQHKPIQ